VRVEAERVMIERAKPPAGALINPDPA